MDHLKHNMRKILLTGLLCTSLLMTACGSAKTPTATADGAAWDSSWTTLGNMVGAEVPDGYTEYLKEDRMNEVHDYYVIWTKGEEIKYTNKDNREVATFDGQIHLLAEETKNEATAAANVAEWKSVSEERFPYTETYTVEYSGQTYEVGIYDYPEDGGPASRAAAANAIRGKWAIHVDVILTNDDDIKTVMEDFLSGIHFAN